MTTGYRKSCVQFRVGLQSYLVLRLNVWIFESGDGMVEVFGLLNLVDGFQNSFLPNSQGKKKYSIKNVKNI